MLSLSQVSTFYNTFSTTYFLPYLTSWLRGNYTYLVPGIALSSRSSSCVITNVKDAFQVTYTDRCCTVYDGIRLIISALPRIGRMMKGLDRSGTCEGMRRRKHTTDSALSMAEARDIETSYISHGPATRPRLFSPSSTSFCIF